MVVKLKGWKAYAFFCSFVGGTVLALYPIIISPMMNVDKYSEYKCRIR